MGKEEKDRLARALEFIHNAQAHLIENVSPSGDPMEIRKHFTTAWELLLDAADVLEPLTEMPLRPLPSCPPGSAA